MKEYEIRQMFLKIANAYSSFAYDDFKVSIWLDLLQDVPFTRANNNLNRYILNPSHEFPPHPGILAESDIQHTKGAYVPNAEETRLMLADQKRESIQITKEIPQFVREQVKLLGQPTRETTS
ncbi:MAG TPA: hypothetical protein IAA29_07825 [Candidatus Paenibacillus intestinavium]|nr:hypothetical protein [Candidatus Paenibacillus intestinavium]